jgi:hypothetical protein
LPVKHHDILDREALRVEFVSQVAIPHPVVQNLNQAYSLPVGVAPNPDEQITAGVAALQHRLELKPQVHLGSGDERDWRLGQLEKHREVGVAQVKQE